MSGCQEGVQSLVAGRHSGPWLQGGSQVIGLLEEVQLFLFKRESNCLFPAGTSDVSCKKISQVIGCQEGVQVFVYRRESSHWLPGGTSVVGCHKGDQ